MLNIKKSKTFRTKILILTKFCDKKPKTLQATMLNLTNLLIRSPKLCQQRCWIWKNLLQEVKNLSKHNIESVTKSLTKILNNHQTISNMTKIFWAIMLNLTIILVKFKTLKKTLLNQITCSWRFNNNDGSD